MFMLFFLGFSNLGIIFRLPNVEDEDKDVTFFQVSQCFLILPLGFSYNSFGSYPHPCTHTFPSSIHLRQL